jgi:hypothetical protein
VGLAAPLPRATNPTTATRTAATIRDAMDILMANMLIPVDLASVGII